MTDHKPQYVACLIDVSLFCDPELLARCGGRVYVSGFFDDSVDVHCFSLTPMVYIEEIEYVAESLPDDDDARDALCMELSELATDGGYYKRTVIDALREQNPDNFKTLDITFDEDEDTDLAVMEYLQGNPAF